MSAIRILIVDDEPNMCATLADILSDEGYSVRTVGTGEAAVRLCAEEDFDVVLMDVRMPGMNGVEAYRQIRRHNEGARVIMMSAYSADELKRDALDAGAVAFLPKPVDVESLVGLIREAKDASVLVVEPDDATAEEVTRALKNQGYRVKSVRSPQEALELIEQIQFDVIAIVAELPTMNGLELYRAIRDVAPRSTTIMISEAGEESEGLARKAVHEGAYTLLRKPLDVDRILGLLQRIEGQRASGELG